MSKEIPRSLRVPVVVKRGFDLDWIEVFRGLDSVRQRTKSVEGRVCRPGVGRLVPGLVFTEQD